MASSLKKIIGYTFLVQVIVFGVGILNHIFMSRWLGPEGFGVVATFLAIAETIHRFTNVGLETAVIYFLGNKRFHNQKLVGAYFINALFLFCVGFIVLLVFFNTSIPEMLFKSMDRASLQEYAWLGVPLLLGFMAYEYGIRIPLGLQRFKQYNSLQFIKPVSLLILLVLVFCFADVNISSVVILLGLTWFLAGAAAWHSAIPFTPLLDKKITTEMVKYGKKVWVGNFINYFNYRADIFLIGFFLSQ
ncbi:oligosaccharide flippase family protein, partial [Candidatus Saccharibacteria bacterium]|nr:oligosaccharide flippase family protein [Candidatus Saccharibacteria bacterium]NIW79286.1 oligosaccharide flippase family protein [Calditrichia bacterium]